MIVRPKLNPFKEPAFSILDGWEVENVDVLQVLSGNRNSLVFINDRKVFLPHICRIAPSWYMIGGNLSADTGRDDILCIVNPLSLVEYYVSSFRAPKNISKFFFLRMLGIYVYPEKYLTYLDKKEDILRVSKYDYYPCEENPLLELTDQDISGSFYLKAVILENLTVSNNVWFKLDKDKFYVTNEIMKTVRELSKEI